MGDKVSRIRHDYRAKHSSGTRPLGTIRYFVVHDAEAPNPTGAAEGVGAFFEAGAQGSTHYGIDVNSTQQYLPDNVIPWGAPPLNNSGVHVECAGKASFTRQQWLNAYKPMFERLGWLIAAKCKAYRIPLRVLSVDDLKRRGPNPARSHGGIVTHHTVSDAFHLTTHTDPGPSFPMDVVLDWAHYYSLPRLRRRGVARPAAAS